MILNTIDFVPFFNKVADIFGSHFSVKDAIDLMDHVEILADANFKCYRANMIAIEGRKFKSSNVNKLVADMEWVARSVGEYRVASKAKINKIISNAKSVSPVCAPGGLSSDDIVYSIGEMLDRLSIEFIKQEDFRVNNRPAHMTESSATIASRVENYLISKLDEIDEKGFYECVHEQRTYDLEGIVQELAL